MSNLNKGLVVRLIKYIKSLLFTSALIGVGLPTTAYAEGGSNNPQVTITPAWQSTKEGDSGVKYVDFKVEISECPTLSSVKIKVYTQDKTAKEGSDYEYNFEKDITFKAGSCVKSKTVSVAIKGDRVAENDEKFSVELKDNGTKNTQKYHFGNRVADVVILNDDDPNADKADLSITKTNDKAPKKAEVGDIIEYTIVAKNNGPKSTKMYVWDTLPDNLEFVSVDDDINGWFGFMDPYDCSYKKSERKIKCDGSKIFDKGDLVTITVKAKVKNTKRYKTTNIAGVQSSNSPKVGDSNKKNNRVSNSFFVKRVNIKIVKKVKKGNKYIKNYDNPPSYNVNDQIKYRVEIKNIGAHPTKIQFWDIIPNGLKLTKIEIQNNPRNYRCDKNGNDIHCYGDRIFKKNDKLYIYITVKALKKGGYSNEVWAETENDDIYYDIDKGNNGDDVPIFVGTNSNSEKITDFKKTIVSPKNSYTVGDSIKFKLQATTNGIKSKYKFEDWEGINGTTANALTFTSVEVAPNSAPMNCQIQTRGGDRYVNCETKSSVADGKKLIAYVNAKLKKAGNICNGAYVFKEYETSNGKDFVYKDYTDVCFDVKKPKRPPVLDADEFHVKLNVEDSIDLKDYTTDPDTPKSKLKYTIISGSLPSGYSMSNDGTISGKYTDSSGRFPKTFNLTVKVTDEDGLSDTDSFKIVVDATDINAINNYYSVVVNQTISGNFITDRTSNGKKTYNPDEGESLKVIQVTKSADLNLTWNSDGSFTYNAPKRKGRYHLTYKIEDKYGQTDTATVYFNVIKPKIKANDDIYDVAKNTPLHSNVLVDNGNGSDVGADLKVISNTSPSHGKVIINKNGDMVYTPDADYTGSDSFKYTIKDKYGQKDTATVFLNIGSQQVQGYVDFGLVNPPETRNLIGNYVIAGNTITCITNKKGTDGESDSFNGTCQNGRDLANNDYMVKYIDIDNSSITWNSSSAKFTLPSSYLELDNGKGIAWAGLFWQGGVNNRDEGFKQRRAKRSGSGYVYENITSSSAVNISNTDADKILIKLDNNQTYIEVKADTLYYDEAHGDYGGYYAAYTNITSILQNAKLTKGEHTITVANLTTNEGREAQVGNYGGWSLVIIYKEDFTGKPRNVSIYSGYQPLGFGGSTNYPEKEVTISGFKLPKSGDVDAQISAFVGEGEQKYGGSRLIYDKMYIKDINQNKLYDMPVAQPNNIFDGAISNSSETPIPNQTNTNGIDIDNYDVSNIIKDIRDHKKDTSQIVVGLVSKDEDGRGNNDSDYVTASMLAFSTQLYAPKICYDYTLRLGEFINIDSEDRNFTADNYSSDPLQLKVMIKSQEADFDLIESKLFATFKPDDVFSYIPGSSKYSPPNTIAYYPAIETDVNKGEIAIGSNANSSGGTIGENQTTYAKLYYSFNKESFTGKFDVNVDAKISFDGINKVPYSMSTAAPKKSIFYIERCPTNPVYDPVYGMLNVERGDSKFTQSEEDRYSLYTQVAGVPYELSLASYKKDSNGKYTLENPLNAVIEVELIDAGTFDNNSSAGYDSICQDPDTYHGGAFVDMNNKSRQKFKIPDDYNNYPSNLALKNAAFRSWVLTVADSNNTRKVAQYPDPFNMRSMIGNMMGNMMGFDKMKLHVYYRTLYYLNYHNNPYEQDYCHAVCSPATNPDPNSSACYQCLREHYGMPICSRDNFAIRPNSYSIAVADTNQTRREKNKIDIGVNNGVQAKDVAAGYVYKLDINATKFGTREKVEGYYFRNYFGKKKKAVATFLPSGISCPDTTEHNLKIFINNGQTGRMGRVDTNGTTITRNAFIVNNVGNYAIHLEDEAWTKVDQAGYKYKPFRYHSDCESNSTKVFNGQLNKKRGCLIATNRGADTLPDLAIRLHPYKFDISTIVTDTSPHNNSDYLYISNIDRTKDLLSSNNIMALNIVGSIKAKGKNNSELSNYVAGCMAQDTIVNIKYILDKNTTLKSALGHNVAMQNYLYDSVVDSSYPITNTVPNINPQGNMNITFNKRYFYTSATGHYSQYLNFDRKFNEPINPFDLTIRDFSIKSPTEVMVADLNSSYIPWGFKDFNTTKRFYYAKAKPKQEFYDDIYDDSVKTPIGIALFCNESVDSCKKYGMDYKDGLTNEYDWFWAIEHDGSKDGKILVQVSSSTNKVTIAPTVIDSFDKGINNSVVVSKNGLTVSDYPYTFYIEPQPLMVTKYPYLLFNSSLDSVPDYIEKGRFVLGGSSWSGKGKTGYATEYNSTGRKTNKVEW